MQAAGMDIKRSRHAQAAVKWREEGSKKGNFSGSMEEVKLCLSAIDMQPRIAYDARDQRAE